MRFVIARLYNIALSFGGCPSTARDDGADFCEHIGFDGFSNIHLADNFALPVRIDSPI